MFKVHKFKVQSSKVQGSQVHGVEMLDGITPYYTPDLLCRYTTILLPAKMRGEVWLIFERNMRKISKETGVA
jgi:hypothetical protein